MSTIDGLRRASLRGVAVFIKDDGTLILEKGTKSIEVAYAKLDRDWLNREFPMFPAMSPEWKLKAWRELVAWDHSYVYTTADQREQEKPNWFLNSFPWAAAIPDTFEFKEQR